MKATGFNVRPWQVGGCDRQPKCCQCTTSRVSENLYHYIEAHFVQCLRTKRMSLYERCSRGHLYMHTPARPLHCHCVTVCVCVGGWVGWGVALQIGWLGGAPRDKAWKMETYCQWAVMKCLQECNATHTGTGHRLVRWANTQAHIQHGTQIKADKERSWMETET